MQKVVGFLLADRTIFQNIVILQFKYKFWAFVVILIFGSRACAMFVQSVIRFHTSDAELFLCKSLALRSLQWKMSIGFCSSRILGLDKTVATTKLTARHQLHSFVLFTIFQSLYYLIINGDYIVGNKAPPIVDCCLKS